jgi:hypothetical protein
MHEHSSSTWCKPLTFKFYQVQRRGKEEGSSDGKSHLPSPVECRCTVTELGREKTPTVGKVEPKQISRRCEQSGPSPIGIAALSKLLVEDLPLGKRKPELGRRRFAVYLLQQARGKGLPQLFEEGSKGICFASAARGINDTC